MDLIESGSMTLPDLEIPVPDRFVEPEARKHLFVPGSPVAKVGIVGNGNYTNLLMFNSFRLSSLLY